MSHDPSTAIYGMEVYPKMIYPDGHSAAHTNAGSMETAGFQGVMVSNEDEENWVKSGKKLEDFGKPEKTAEEAAAIKPKAAW